MKQDWLARSAAGPTLASMAWFLLLLASACEIGWALSLKQTEGLTKLWPTVAVLIVAIASVGLLAMAARSLPIGTAYAVWTGIGAAGTAIGGILLFHEAASVGRVTCIVLIIAGVVGLKLFAK